MIVLVRLQPKAVLPLLLKHGWEIRVVAPVRTHNDCAGRYFFSAQHRINCVRLAPRVPRKPQFGIIGADCWPQQRQRPVG